MEKKNVLVNSRKEQNLPVSAITNMTRRHGKIITEKSSHKCSFKTQALLLFFVLHSHLDTKMRPGSP